MYISDVSYSRSFIVSQISILMLLFFYVAFVQLKQKFFISAPSRVSVLYIDYKLFYSRGNLRYIKFYLKT